MMPSMAMRTSWRPNNPERDSIGQTGSEGSLGEDGKRLAAKWTNTWRPPLLGAIHFKLLICG